ncbi:glycosyltransferase family 1 protein [Paenibacillus sp. GCM10023248]|uniref:glycosyltransferase family 1 protein n=1 Tax=unclassified Paenibacillus TaxID=185978 RepID=UPI002377FFE3|nr:glycosyltransferase family 1 protein [Paenibacillus sp. MAHUQ-63]MDD9266516.1 glycosyltransferase family 1 protein [Paenibacillus sp. MAHUQ-63]
MGNPIRILHVVVNMNRGGAETLLMNLYRNIDRTKVQFDFLTSKAGVFDAEITEMGGVIHRIPYVSDVGHAKYIQALDHFFAAHSHYKVVHAHMDKMSGFVLRSAKKAGAPIRIAHSHNTSSEGSMAAKAYKWVAGTFIRSCATHFLACSHKAAQWLFANRGNQAVILKNGIESEKFAFSLEVREQVRQELSLPLDHYVVGHVGRFAHQKNHAFLIELFAKLNQEKKNTVLVLAGDGPLRAEMEKKVMMMDLQHQVRFLGVRSDITRLLQAFDMFVFPSLHEGLPVTLIEAQGAGLPCLISDEITQEVDMGIHLVERLPLRDKSLWVDRMKAVMTKNSPRQIPQMSLSNKGYDIKNTAGWTEGFYLGILR